MNHDIRPLALLQMIENIANSGPGNPTDIRDRNDSVRTYVESVRSWLEHSQRLLGDLAASADQTGCSCDLIVVRSAALGAVLEHAHIPFSFQSDDVDDQDDGEDECSKCGAPFDQDNERSPVKQDGKALCIDCAAGRPLSNNWEYRTIDGRKYGVYTAGLNEHVGLEYWDVDDVRAGVCLTYEESFDHKPTDDEIRTLLDRLDKLEA